MLTNFNFNTDHIKNEKRSELGERFAKFQRELIQANTGMLVIVDGWESSGKGFVLTDLTRELDPRYFKVRLFGEPREEEEIQPFLWKFVKQLPAKGEIVFFNRSFYYRLFHYLDLPAEELQHELMDISLLERLLVANGTLVVKLFLNQKEETMRQRIRELKSSPHHSFFITQVDLEQLSFYEQYRSHLSMILDQTSFVFSPWKIISAEDMKNASRIALNYCMEQLQKHLNNKRQIPFQSSIQPKMVSHIPKLKDLDLTQEVSSETYHTKKEALQQRAGELLYQLWLKQIPCIVIFEGTDAAGKGGAIRRLRRRMDPRQYDVATTAAPTEAEDQYHYLWRFYKTFPSRGRMTIYDRSWYGRVLVERVEGFTEEKRWREAYDEINELEHNLVEEGTLLMKFLIVIDKKEQKKRLDERKNDPEKSYKLTDEDWRNHEKFDDYEQAMDEMLEKTSTEDAPWTIVEGNQKYFARTKVLETFIETTEKFLETYERNLPPRLDLRHLNHWRTYL